MKKNTRNRPYILPLMAAMIFFLVILCALSSCELQSLATPQETTDGASTVYQPVEITTTQEESPTTAETTTAPLSTTAPPATTTAPQISYYNPLNGLPCEGGSFVSATDRAFGKDGIRLTNRCSRSCYRSANGIRPDQAFTRWERLCFTSARKRHCIYTPAPCITGK